MTFLVVVAAMPCDAGIYVDRTATGANDGSSWADAYTDLQGALDQVVTERGGFVLIAEGVYTPTGNYSTSGPRANPAPAGSPGASFQKAFYIAGGQLDASIRVTGGFPAGGGSEPDWTTYPTILSGDVGGDDTTNHGIVERPSDVRGTNACTVMIVNGLGPGVLIEGVIFTGGTGICDQAGGLAISNDGYKNYESTTILRHCAFIGNAAYSDGGGLAITDLNAGGHDPTIDNCAFNHNSAGGLGGAVFVGGHMGKMTITHSSFVGNSATGEDSTSVGAGGAIAFGDYTAGQGRPFAMAVEHSSFRGNTSGTRANVMSLYSQAYGDGGEQPPSYDSVTVDSCVLWGTASSPFDSASSPGGDLTAIDGFHLTSTYVQGATSCPDAATCDAVTRSLFSTGDTAADAEAVARPESQVEETIRRLGLGPQKPNPFRRDH